MTTSDMVSAMLAFLGVDELCAACDRGAANRVASEAALAGATTAPIADLERLETRVAADRETEHAACEAIKNATRTSKEQLKSYLAKGIDEGASSLVTDMSVATKCAAKAGVPVPELTIGFMSYEFMSFGVMSWVDAANSADREKLKALVAQVRAWLASHDVTIPA